MLINLPTHNFKILPDGPVLNHFGEHRNGRGIFFIIFLFVYNKLLHHSTWVRVRTWTWGPGPGSAKSGRTGPGPDLGQSTLTAITGPQFQTTPTSAFNSLLPTSTFHDPVVQPPRPASPMTHFLNSTSSLDSYNWGGDNRSTSLNSSGPFDFSRMDFSGLSSSGLEPPLGAHQLYTFGTGQDMLGAHPTSAPLMSTTACNFIPPNSAHIPPMSAPLYADLPNSAAPLTSTTANDFIPPNTAHTPPTSTPLYPALPTSPPLESTTASDSKKRKSYEEQNAHCVLPEGSRRARKGRHIEGAHDENTPCPKKRNTNTDKKGKGNKGRK